MITVLSPKFIILYAFILSAVYVHFRGQVRFKFFRQLSDHSTFLAPINILMYWFSKVPNEPYLPLNQFPQLQKITDQWQMIAEEARQLATQGHVKASDKYDDVGFNSFFRTGWKRFYLTWYGEVLPSAKELCPKTIALLQSVPGINAAMFAMLPQGARLVRHRDPYAGSVRYHLGLITPNSEKCCIYVDGIPYYWRDGQAVMFDETFIHYAENQTDMDRIILFCDVDRPLKSKWVAKINHWFGHHVMNASKARNLDTDKIGWINKVFGYVYQVRVLGKEIKKKKQTTLLFFKVGDYFGVVVFNFCPLGLSQLQRR